MRYVNVKTSAGIETVEEFGPNVSAKEKRKTLSDFNESDDANHYYLSSRASKEWYNRE